MCYWQIQDMTFSHQLPMSRCYAHACRIWRDHRGLGLGRNRWKKDTSKGEEISTIEKIEGDKVYEAMYNSA